MTLTITLLYKKLRPPPSQFFTKLLFPSDSNFYGTNPPTGTHCNYISAVTYARLYSIPLWISAEKRLLARILCIQWLPPCPAGHIAYRAVTGGLWCVARNKALAYGNGVQKISCASKIVLIWAKYITIFSKTTTDIHTHTPKYIHTHNTHAHTPTYTHTKIHTHTNTHTHPHTHAHTHTHHTHTPKHTHQHTNTNTHTNTYTHQNTHTKTHTPKHTHQHTHTPTTHTHTHTHQHTHQPHTHTHTHQHTHSLRSGCAFVFKGEGSSSS